MQTTKTLAALLAAATLALGGSAVTAATYNVIIGDNDGFGVGVADNADASGSGVEVCCVDFRSAAEQAATNGAEQTDINSALFAPVSQIGNFFFNNFGGTVTSATLTIDIGGLQVNDFGETLARYNGVLQTGLLALQQGATQTNVLSFNLDAATLLSMNTSGFLDFELDRNGTNDAIFIDYVRLRADVAVIPVPAAGLLLLGGLGAIGALRRRRNRT